MIEEYIKRKKALDDQFEREKPLELADGQTHYKVDQWNPELMKQREEKGMVRVSAVDLIEKEYLEEYKKIIDKDRELGKDFNNQAYEDMKKARYHFEYLRT